MFGVVEANVNDLGKHVQEQYLDLRISNEKMFSDVRMFSCISCSSFGHSSRRTGKNPKFVVYRVEKIPQLRKELHTSCISRQARLNEILTSQIGVHTTEIGTTGGRGSSWKWMISLEDIAESSEYGFASIR